MGFYLQHPSLRFGHAPSSQLEADVQEIWTTFCEVLVSGSPRRLKGYSGGASPSPRERVLGSPRWPGSLHWGLGPDDWR